MRKRLSKSPSTSQDANKSEGEARQLRSAKSLKHKRKSIDMVKDDGSKSLPSKVKKKYLKDNDKKSIISKNIDMKVESKLNCRKSLLDHFNDVKDQDEEDIPLGKLLGNKINDKDVPTNSSIKGSFKKSFCETPTRKFLRPRRSLNGKSPTLNDSQSNIESLEKSEDDLLLGSSIINNNAGECSSSENSKNKSPEASQNKNSEVPLIDDCHNADQNLVLPCSTKQSEKDEIVANSASNNVNGNNPSETHPSGNNFKCTDPEISCSFHNNHSAPLHKELLSFKDTTLVIDNDMTSSVQLTPSRNTNQSFQKSYISPTRKPVDATSSTPVCYNSPGTSILRKRKLQDSDFSCSPSTKIRRVAFSEIVSTVEIPNRRDDLTTRDLKPHNLELCRSEGSLISQDTNKENSAPIFPELTNSLCPIEVILPRISTSPWVRGLKNLLSAKNIKTVGDLAAMSEPELETLPVPQPKSSRIRDALQYWMDHTNNKNKKSAKDCREEVVGVEGKVGEDRNSGKETQPVSLQGHVFGTDDSRQTVTIGEMNHELSVKVDEPDSANGKLTLKMFDALEEVLGRCKSEELSRTQLKTMLSKLSSIQIKVAEHITNTL